jgi:hypothetical protein
MATTTPNYLWSVPTSSDLVKNGATAIETLGDSVDASLWNSGFGQASKNKIINGDMTINQRAFTSTTTNGTYTFDRFLAANSGGTSTYTARTFTAGAAPVAGYEGKNFIEVASTGQTLTSSFTQYAQRIEGVRTLAGQPVTISFWAKAASGTPKVAVDIQQYFGDSGSPSAAVNNYFGEVTLTTSFVRYSLTATLGSMTGKTISDVNNLLRVALWTSAGSDFSARSINIGLQTATISFWGVQVEYGSYATPFQTASGGSPQAELAMCQRYYFRSTSDATTPVAIYANGTGTAATSGRFGIQLPVTMRTTPTSLDYANLGMSDSVNAATAVTVLALATNLTWNNVCGLNATTASGITTYRPYFLVANSSASAYVGLSAEL